MRLLHCRKQESGQDGDNDDHDQDFDQGKRISAWKTSHISSAFLWKKGNGRKSEVPLARQERDTTNFRESLLAKKTSRRLVRGVAGWLESKVSERREASTLRHHFCKINLSFRVRINR